MSNKAEVILILTSLGFHNSHKPESKLYLSAAISACASFFYVTSEHDEAESA